MSLGPTTIFDKSALQGLNVDEACWFGNFYRVNLMPMFFIETLADLEKQVRAGRTPEDVVGNIASKTAGMHVDPNVYHQDLCGGQLLGSIVEMRGLPVVGGATSVATADAKGIIFKQPTEAIAFQRWQRKEFLQVERDFARSGVAR